MSITLGKKQMSGLVLLSALAWAAAPPALQGQSQSAGAVQRTGVQNQPVEWDYKSQKTYGDPFNDVDVDVVFTKEEGRQWRVPAFWAGGNQWRVRFAPPAPGVYSYRVESTDPSNPELNGQQGTLRVEPYRGANALLLHGPLRVSENRRYFQHADGTPFFWLGDTWWKGLARRISFDEFKVLAADRHEKGFNLVQIVAGLYPDEPPFDPRGNNEGGFAWEPEYARINPAYFDYADRRIAWLVKSELTPAIVSCWGYYLPLMGVEKMKKHWRNLVARYGAYPVVWILAGEVSMPYYRSPQPEKDRDLQVRDWTEIARYLRAIDPYHHPITAHPILSGRMELAADDVLDFDMLQTRHGAWFTAANNAIFPSAHFSKTPPMPVLVGECAYEGHRQNTQDNQRFAFWVSLMNGAAGYTYGAGGIWQANGTSEPHGPSPQGITYEDTPWNEAMRLPGSRQVGIGKALLSRYPWWRFEPRPDWVTPRGVAFLEAHRDWFDAGLRYEEAVLLDQKLRAPARSPYPSQPFLLPYAAGVPGLVRFIYVPTLIVGPDPPLVLRIERDAIYHAYYFDPSNGRKYKLGKLARPETTRLDAVLEKGKLTANAPVLSSVRGIQEHDVMVSLDIGSEDNAGVVLRYQNPDNYVLAVYSPKMKGIWIHDRQKGAYGSRLGFKAVPTIGARIHLVAESHGKHASVTLSDGAQVYRSLPVTVTNTKTGGIGVWSEPLTCAGGNFGACAPAAESERSPHRQVFDNLIVERIRAVDPDANENLVVLDAWQAPMLPLVRDWVLVLER